MRSLILLLCLKFIGVLCEVPSGELSINQYPMTDTYHYHDNLETNIMCKSRGDNLTYVTLKYIPQEGEPHTTITKSYYNTMYLKLTTANHNGIIECHIRGKDANQTLTTKLENIEILKASGSYESKKVFRGFYVNGLLLTCYGSPGNLYYPHRHQFNYDCSDKEILNITLLKGEGETATCVYPDKWLTDPGFEPFVDYKNNTYTYFFNASIVGSGIFCTVTDKNNENITYQLSLMSRSGYSTVPIVGLPRAEILLSYTTNNINSVCISPKEKAITQVEFLHKAAHLVLLEYDGYTMTCTYDWCYDESQVECLESTEDNKTPKTCTFALKDGVKESIVKCAGAKNNSDNYIKLIKKDQLVVA